MVKRFLGLNNVTDPMRLGMEWLVQADNVDITDTGGLKARVGYSLAQAGSDISGAYTTKDFERMYFIDNGTVKVMDTTSVSHAIGSVSGGGPWYWAEVNGDVYFTNGTSYNVISPDNTFSAWGAEGRTDLGAPQFAAELGTWPYTNTAARERYEEENTYPPPAGCGPITEYNGRMYAAQYLQTDDQTVIWFSKALGYHLFDLAKDYIVVPGEVLMLVSVADGMIIGTADSIYMYNGQTMALLADYGVVPGQHWDFESPSSVLFWSTRGLCRAMPFANLTERQVSVAPGLQAGGVILRRNGRESYVVSIRQGGSAFNPL